MVSAITNERESKEMKKRDLQNKNVKKKGGKGNERNGIGKDGEEKGNALTWIRPKRPNGYWIRPKRQQHVMLLG